MQDNLNSETDAPPRTASAAGGDLQVQWTQVRNCLRDAISDAAFRSWVEPLRPLGFDGRAVSLAVPTRLMRDWVNTHYTDRIRRAWTSRNPAVQSVEIVVTKRTAEDGPGAADPAAPAPAPASAPAGTRTSAAASSAEPASYAEEPGESLQAGLDPRFTFGNFVVGKPNEFAYAAARRLADSDQIPFNPLFLYGGVGLGKTHLMHAIAWALRERDPERNIVYLSAEKFMHRYVRALQDKSTVTFKEQFRSVDVLMIDDIQFFSGKNNTQEEFFHTFNALIDQGRQIVLSADKSPSDLEDIEERLRSRLSWGLVADIHPTTYELRLGILNAKAEQLGVQVAPRVLEFLAHKITSNVRELEGALNKIKAHAELVGRPITLETTQEALRDVIRAHERRITIDEIQRKVAEHFNIRVADMSAAGRRRTVARPRQVAMYLAKTLTEKSLPEIGRKFGGRDHTTVMHAVKKIEELTAADRSFAEDVELLRRTLGG